jgi:DivIVA domain-containing protein
LETFSLVKRGYNTEEVDAYISTLEQVIKSYKDKDNAIKNAIISAQVAADNILANARAQADEYKSKIRRQLQTVKDSIEVQRKRAQAFQDVYSNMLRKYLTEIEVKDTQDLHAKLNELEQIIDQLTNLEELEAKSSVPPRINVRPLEEHPDINTPPANNETPAE